LFTFGLQASWKYKVYLADHFIIVIKHKLYFTFEGKFGNSSTDLEDQGDDKTIQPDFAILKAGVLGLIFVVATCGNLCLLYTLWTKRKRNTRTQLFLLHLCCADLVVAFFQVLPQLCIEITHRFLGSDFVCRLVKYLQVVGMFASTYMIVAMTIDRYHAVCKPMVSFFKGSFRRYVAIGAAWLISLAFSTPQLFIFSLQEVEANLFDCWASFIEPWGSKIYISWMTLAVFVIPAIILLFCQIKICTGIYFNMKRKALQANTSDGRTSAKGVSNAMLKTVKMTFVIIMAYSVCWSPFFVVQLWSAWSPTTAPTNGPMFVLIMLLASLNSCTNPWIYLYYMQSISIGTDTQVLLFCLGSLALWVLNYTLMLSIDLGVVMNHS
uniref:G-protein coupled receptors family 1 profile domain-containing protein n=1 Tax=Esox lucius TaxID=8010 RepID=A0AAY5KC93_ESOLU